DFIGGTLIEVQTKAGPADLAKMRATIGSLQLGDFQLQQFGAPDDVLIRISEQPGGDEAQQAAVQKVRNALGNDVDYRPGGWWGRVFPPSFWPTARSAWFWRSWRS